ncbi:MAG: type II toxin-antitoxin system VapC family toxin [Kineosporiaceae bacterium]|nr:type II toxin-antitoxin system VapC family toxin [Kineosporiaceae bacterium]
MNSITGKSPLVAEAPSAPPPAVLLDTHALLWALTDPSRLGSAARAVIEDSATRLVVSAATAWELSTKHRLGRLPQADPLLAAYSRHVSRLGAQELPVTSEHALLAGALDWAHRDPFDRMLAAQCLLESLSLVSCDSAFSEAGMVPRGW